MKLTLVGFKPFLHTLKDKRKSRQPSVLPNVRFIMNFQNRYYDGIRSSHKKRLSIWCDYYSRDDKSDWMIPKNIITPRIRKVLKHRKNVNTTHRKFTAHSDKINHANRRSAISKIKETQSYSEEFIKFSNDDLEEWWNFKEAPEFWWGFPRPAKYYRQGFVIVPWLEENVGPILEPIFSGRILYGNGWMLNFGDASLSFSEKDHDKMKLLFTLRWL